MAIRLADVYPAHRRRVILVAAAMLLAINFVLYILLSDLGYPLLERTLLIILPVMLLQLFAIIIVVRYALEPLNVLMRAITHISNQPNDVVPPDINQPRFARNGLKDMVQTIYDRTNLPLEKTNSTADIPIALLDQLPCGIIGLDASNTIVYANPAAPVITDSQNRKVLQLLFAQSNTLDHWLSDVSEHKVSATEAWDRIANKMPEEKDRKIYDIVASYEKNAPSGIETIIVTIDQTVRYSTDEDALDFISIAAHELRGPITVIRGYLDVLHSELDPLLDTERTELMKRLDVSASRLSSYINNILGVAKYDRHQLRVDLREDRLADIYALIADDLQLRAQTQSRLLVVDIPADLPTIAADRNSLTEVLANLVDNAIKYSSEGGTVNVSAHTRGDFVACSIRDYGIGIPTSVLQNLFSKFYRSHRSRASVAGTGLGLYISRAIIQSHGGKITASSKEGEGSTFTFEVPIYSTVADKLLKGDNVGGIIETSSGWIRNHSKIEG